MKSSASILPARIGLVVLVWWAVVHTTLAADVTPRPLMTDGTRRVLREHCTPGQLDAIDEILGRLDPADLGPRTLSNEEQRLLAGPRSSVRLDPREYSTSGDGTPDAPWEAALSGFLRDRPTPPVTVIVPPGCYRELELVVPDGVWLRAEGKAVLVPPPGADDGKPIIRLQSRTGLIGFVLDGSAARNIQGVFVEENTWDVVVARNYIHHVPQGDGIGGFRQTARRVHVLENRLEHIGSNGIITSSEWVVAHNAVIHAGIHVQGNQGWGRDGIIVGGRGSRTVIRNNLVLSSKSADLFENNLARHAYAGEMCTDSLLQGNLGIVCGGMRGGIALSDGSHRNRVVGNVILATPLDGKVARMGVIVNGSENSVRHNAVIGFPMGLHLSAKSGETPRTKNVLADNYLEVGQLAVNINTHGQAEDFDARQVNTIADNQVVIRGTAPEDLNLNQDSGGELTLTEGPESIVLHNGLATARIDKATGAIPDFHANDGVNLVTEIHIHPEFLTGACDEYKVVREDASLVDLSFVFLRQLREEEGEIRPSPRGLRIELHYAMQPDTPGLYTYFVWKALSGPAVREYPILNRTGVSKFRIVTQNTPYYYVDEQRSGVYPMHGMEKERTAYNATWIFTDGTIRSKYDDLSLQYREHLLGKYNDTHGIFFIIPSNEGIGGGPFKQRVCQQYDNLMFMHLLDGHCGLPGADPVFTDGWEHVFGPWLLYVNRAENKTRVLEKAKARAAREIAKWPYDWVSEPAYAAHGRVTVSGRLRITDGSSPEGAFILLGDRGMHYQERTQNYLYYRQADKEGRFTIPAVRPGNYKLYAFVKGVLGEYVQDGVRIAAGRENDLGEIDWTPETFGQTLWQIGTPDRTGEEFWMGKHHHQWGMHIIYPRCFPNDVDFHVGTSREDTDWPYYHLTARTWDNIDHYNLGYRWDEKIKRMRFDFDRDQPANPNDKAQFDPFTPVPYRIHFSIDKDYQGEATLSIAVAGTMFEGPTLVYVNDTDVTHGEPLRFADSATLRRCTGIGVYTLTRVALDASLLKQGENIIVLTAPRFTPIRGKPPKQTIGNLVYDCLRLEAIPAETGTVK